MAGATPGASAAPEDDRVAAIRGALVMRGSQPNAWAAVKADAELRPGSFLIAMPEAELLSGNKAVKVLMFADLLKRLPEPVFESAIQIEDKKGNDFACRVDRGLAIFSNAKDKGDATVRVRFQDQTWTITLKGAKSAAAVGLFSRHPAGLRNRPKDMAPTVHFYVVAVEGKVQLHAGEQEVALQAPPGPAMFQWDSIAGNAPGPQDLESLRGHKPQTPEEVLHVRDVYNRLAKFNAKPVADALKDFASSADPRDQMVAGVVSSALDNLPGLLAALNVKDPQYRDRLIVVLRHWAGRDAKHLDALRQHLTKSAGFAAREADLVLFMLYGANETELALPELYDHLIILLLHKQPLIREMAAWHLYRLVPEGKDIVYDSQGTQQDREAAAKKWRDLIPAGDLPPHLRKEKPDTPSP
jgi:hypothetical protein